MLAAAAAAAAAAVIAAQVVAELSHHEGMTMPPEVSSSSISGLLLLLQVRALYFNTLVHACNAASTTWLPAAWCGGVISGHQESCSSLTCSCGVSDAAVFVLEGGTAAVQLLQPT
jgi:hypothetical protein